VFNAGAISFALQMMGAEVFQQDAKAADKAVSDLGKSAEASSKKVAPLGTEVDKTGKASKDAKAPVEGAGTATKKLGDESATAAPKVKQTASEVAALKKQSDEAGKVIGTAAFGIGAAFLAVAGIAVGTYAKFDEASSKTTAATQATVEQQKLLKESAIELGASSIYSAREAAQAQTELAKAGVAVSDILAGGLAGSLALAAAGELEVARAAEIAATTLSVFGLAGDQAGHVADLLAAGAGKAQGSVEDLSLGLGYIGVSFARLNIPLEDTVGTLALLAANGLLGEKAGTGLRSVISSLTAPVAKGAAEMEKYGINVFDASGNFVGMQDTAEQLRKGLGGLDEQTRSAALGAIFGAEAASAAGILYKSGAKGVKEWTDNVDDQGFAAKQAADKTDNLMGDLELLGGSMDSILIKTGGQANGVLRDMVQILIGVTDWYGSLDEGLQGTVLTIGVATGAALLLGGTFLLAVPKIAAFRTALQTLNSTMGKTALAGGIVGIAITAAAITFGAWASAQADAKAKTDSYIDTLDELTGKITENSRDTAKANLATEKSWLWMSQGSAYDAAEKLGVSLDDVTDAALGNADAYKRVKASFDDIKKGDVDRLNAYDLMMSAISGESDAVSDSQRIWMQKTDATDVAAASTEKAAAATKAAAEVVTKADADHLADLAATDAAFMDLGGAYDTIIQKNKDTAQATADATDSSKDSWEDYYDGFSVGLDDYLAELQTMVDNQNNWESNMVSLAGKVSEGTLEELRKMGPEGAPLVADLVNASSDELARLETLFAEQAGNATGAFATRLTDSKTVIDAASAQLGTDAANEIATKLSAGTATVEQILVDYGIKIEGFQPSIDIETAKATEKARVFFDSLRIQATTAGSYGTYGNGLGVLLPAVKQADGGVVQYFANGGTSERHVAQIERAGAMRVWAEPETGGEAYIPMAPAKRGRSTAILEDVAGQFGYQLVPYGVQSFANGSMPGPRSTSARASWTGDINVTTPPNEDPRILAKQLAREFTDQMAG
jgi:TP901 family phage tail tape measure protein